MVQNLIIAILEDNFSNHTALIPYGTMLREQSKKWKTDERKVMNWEYYEEEDYYIDSKGVRFSFNTYRKRADKEGFVRDFKEYVAEKYDNNHQIVKSALTPKGYIRKINVNPSWEYFKEKQKEQLSSPETGKVYSQRKIDVESVFGWMKASLGFTRYHVRGMEKVRKETGILIMALNIRKLEATMRKKEDELHKKGIESKISKRLLLFMPFVHEFRVLMSQPLYY